MPSMLCLVLLLPVCSNFPQLAKGRTLPPTIVPPTILPPTILLPAPVVVVPVSEPLTGVQTGSTSASLIHTANGPIVGVGTDVTNTVQGPGGVQHVHAGSRLQGGGGFGFGQSSTVVRAERDGALPLEASSHSLLVTTPDASLGQSQSSTHSMQPSGVAGVPGTVSATQAHSSAIATTGGFAQAHQHLGTITAGGPEGPRADIGPAVQNSVVAARIHQQNLVKATQLLGNSAANLKAQARNKINSTKPVATTG